MTTDIPQALTPREAMDLLSEHPEAILVDIRSTMEFLFVGHPQGAVHVPWIDEPDWTINPQFTTEIRKRLLGGALCEAGKPCAPVILICRSGKRSLEAGKALIQDGLTTVYHIDEGFEGDLDAHHHRSSVGGWRFHGLPWEQC
ncbi:rhodanese-like domain-containing protein [Rhabdochromatium marinum]|uniref:rhodanese-like domain-containing protein n=1 Tax=Rhabdochromatium marinum TaxID=48729 RepID=UPI0019046F5F|nr:rhodanese-like domain-containing protein [Rhabdochromatium marinum]MBK1649587.1 sulfurtransferase [Rhabdochromatium marinum]